MSLFKKPKKHMQHRVFINHEDDENESNDDIKNESSSKRKSPNKNRHQPKKTLLSFQEEDEGEVFQVRKSSHSKKIMKLLDKERRKKKEEKSKTDVLKPKSDDNQTEIVTGDLVMVVKNTEMPKILNGRAALCAGRNDMSSDDELEQSTMHKFSVPSSVKLALESGTIPDAATIHAARKRRQRAREQKDFIPIEETPEKDRGRLIREDDDSDEERITMTINLAERDRDKRREQFFAAQDKSDSDTDKEQEEWENQQIRKGVTGAQLIAASQDSTLSQSVPSMFRMQQSKKPYTASIPTPNVKIEPGTPRTPQAITEKLQERYTSIKDSYKKHETQLKNVRSEIIVTRDQLKQLRVKAPKAAEHFRFYQELRGYVTDLVECLDEKIPFIVNLEERAMDLLHKRADALIERRRQDIRDQVEEIAIQSKSGIKRIGGEEARIRRAAEREGRRSRRRRAREIPGTPKHIDGMSSDDEIPDQEMINFQNQKEQILIEANNIFSDVIDEFSSVKNIMKHFEKWRSTDMQSYMEVYANLCLPRVLSPLLKLSLILWNPLTDTDDLEKYKWYPILMLYGSQTKETELSLKQDPDLNLVPTVIEKIIVPKLTLLVEKCWDPMSSSQTLRLVGLIGRYIRKYPSLGPESKALNNLFNAILDKLKSSVEHDIFIPIFPKQVLESKSPFFQRQFANGLKLLRNVTSWQGIINEKMLKDLALGALLNRYLLSGLRICQLTDAVSKAGLINHILPRTWFHNDVKQLKMFIEFLTNSASKLDKENPLHLESIEIAANILKSLRISK